MPSEVPDELVVFRVNPSKHPSRHFFLKDDFKVEVKPLDSSQSSSSASSGNSSQSSSSASSGSSSSSSSGSSSHPSSGSSSSSDFVTLYSEGGLSLAFKQLNDNYGGVTWRITNSNSTSQTVVLVRGATIKYQGQEVSVPQYVFGDAYAEVYYANQLSGFVQNLSAISLYTLAVLNMSNGSQQLGFVFQVPGNSAIEFNEYGFTDLVSMTGYVSPVTPASATLYLVFYDYSEILDYEAQTNYYVSAPSDPYAVYSYAFNTTIDVQPIMTRVILAISQDFVNLGKNIASLLGKYLLYKPEGEVKGIIDKFISLIKHL